ncbi:hypothetical protein Y1Q_0022373 [Alligator mississippiensis]|uniref:Uncharacterized protein n=1 Tax=Alligator mississippiensis TaxID=8496 RepID=A0A151P1Y0_ALLMI|nr:hypothetical protein Y1Q_0022373 [Alligator mississippiensis]
MDPTPGFCFVKRKTKQVPSPQDQIVRGYLLANFCSPFKMLDQENSELLGCTLPDKGTPSMFEVPCF